MSLRDWIDPTRLYNPNLPTGRLNFFWGGCLVPIGIFAMGSLLIGRAYYVWGEIEWLGTFCTLLPMGFLGFLLYTRSATRRLHDLGNPPELSPIITPTNEWEGISYYVRLLRRLLTEPGVRKNSPPADETARARSSNHQGDS
jgi:hypothetical protein